jgi:transcriptional regulator with XRE-family HTH domain
MEQLSIKIRTLRSVFGYSQEYIAYQLGISQAAYSKKESGQNPPSLSHLEQLAKLYGFSLIDFMQYSMPDLIKVALSNQKND